MDEMWLETRKEQQIFLQSVQSGNGAHCTSGYSGGSLKLYLHFPICLRGVHKDNFNIYVLQQGMKPETCWQWFVDICASSLISMPQFTTRKQNVPIYDKIKG